METENLKIVRGIILTEKDLRVLVGRRFVDLWDNARGKDIRFSTHELSRRIGVDVYEYYNLYVLGETIVTTSDGLLSVPHIPEYVDIELGKKLNRYGDCFEIDIKTIVVRN